MQELIREFIESRRELLEIIECFPVTRRELILFGEWSLKDMIVHFSGWASYQIKTLEQFKDSIEPKIPQNLKTSINKDLIQERAFLSWDKVYNDFLRTSQLLINKYEGLPKELWEKKIWNGKETTPKEFIQIEINHYKNTHGPQIKTILKKIK